MNEQQGPFGRVRGWLQTDALRDRLGRVLPSGTALDGWVEAALQQIRTTRGIGSALGVDGGWADATEVLGALFTLATLGLRPEGPLGQAYIVCKARRKRDRTSGHWVTEGVDCIAGVGYRGLCALAYQDPQVREPEAVLVYEGDEFVPIKGSTPSLLHRINPLGTSRRIIGAYAGLRWRDGYYSFQAFRGVDLEAHRVGVLATLGLEVETDAAGVETFYEEDHNKRTLAPDWKVRGVPWAAHPGPMLQKTALRWAAKFWNLGPKFDAAANLVALEEAGVPQGLADAGKELVAPVKPRTPVPPTDDAALVQQMVQEATGRPPAPANPAAAPTPGEPSAEEQAAILAAERAEAEAWEREHVGGNLG